MIRSKEQLARRALARQFGLNEDMATPLEQQSAFRFILGAVRRRAPSHVVVLVSVMLAVGCSIGSQYAVKFMVNVLAADRTDQVWLAFALLAGLIAADNMAWRVGGWIAARSFVMVTGDIRRRLFNHMLGHSHGYFADRRPGMLAGRISATGNAVFRIESLTFWNVLPPLFAVGGAMALLLSVNAPMGGAVIVVAIALGFILKRLAQGGEDLHQDYAVKAATVDGELVDVINNVGVVRAFGALRRERRRFAGRVGVEMSARQQSLRYLEKLRIFHAFTTAGLTAALLAWTLHLWILGRVSPGDVVLVTTLGFTVLHGTRDLAVALVEMVQDFARLSDALRALLVPHDMVEDPLAPPLSVERGAIHFEHVGFGYAESGDVLLRDFTLDIKPGEKVGLVGRSGSGKTTLLALLQRQFDLSDGTILIDGEDIAGRTQSSLAGAIAVVSQDVQLFHRTVMENIRYGKPNASDEEVRAAAEAAECMGFIDKLSDRFDTIVGERGMKLSGGQRQRIAIARAFLCDSPILLLDEATSALDSESEKLVQEALSRLSHGRTVIAVAHRLSTLRDFDRIVVMDSGRIVDQGAPDELAARPGPYRDLLAHQSMQMA